MLNFMWVSAGIATNPFTALNRRQSLLFLLLLARGSQFRSFSMDVTLPYLSHDHLLVVTFYKACGVSLDSR